MLYKTQIFSNDKVISHPLMLQISTQTFSDKSYKLEWKISKCVFTRIVTFKNIVQTSKSNSFIVSLKCCNFILYFCSDIQLQAQASDKHHDHPANQ